MFLNVYYCPSGSDVSLKAEDLGCRGRESLLSFLSMLCLWQIICKRQFCDNFHWLLSHGLNLQLQRFVFFRKNLLEFDCCDLNLFEGLDLILFNPFSLRLVVKCNFYCQFFSIHSGLS